MLIWLAIMIVAVALDQLTKYLTIFYLKPVGSVPLFDLFGWLTLDLTYVENTGAAFGMMKDSRWIFMVISTLAIIGVLVYMFVRRPQSKWECAALSLIVGGGIGNMIDRTLMGYVVDMIDFSLGGVPVLNDFPVFNVADSFVTVGAVMLMVVMLSSIIKESRAEKRAVKAAVGASASATEALIETESLAEAEQSAETEQFAEAESPAEAGADGSGIPEEPMAEEDGNA